MTLACSDEQTLAWLPLPRPYERRHAEAFVGGIATTARESGRGAATGNRPSQRAAEPAGLVREGVARNAGFVRAGRVDVVVYALVHSDLGLPPVPVPSRR